jgi:uncharacterized glyoxalase superfamily protein PhnB
MLCSRHQSTAIGAEVLRQIKRIARPAAAGHCRNRFFFPDFLAMSDHVTHAAAKPVITAAEPQLFVADIKLACDFFISKLGFAVDFTYGEPPYYAQVKRDAARINLRCVERAVIDPVQRDREELLGAALTVATADEIRQLYAEFQAAGVAFFQTLKPEPWGALDFIIKDIDGNLLLFAGPAT